MPRSRRIAYLLLLTLGLVGCAAKADKTDVLRRQLDMKGRIDGRTYKAPERAFRIEVHPESQAWLDRQRPVRPDDARIPGDRWLRDGRRKSVDGSRIDYVTFWEAGEALDRWDGYDSHTVEVRRLREGTTSVDPGAIIDAVVAEYAERYKERFGGRVSSRRIARGEVESGGRRYVHTAYEYEIKATVIPNTLARTYEAYTNLCVFQPEPYIVAVSISEVVAEGRDLNEKQRKQRISRDGCDLDWLGTLKIPMNEAADETAEAARDRS